VASLLALDLALGAPLETAIRDCVERGEAFCVLDRRLSVRRREEELEWLGATHVQDEGGRSTLRTGRDVADRIGLVMLTSGTSGPAKAAQLSWDALTASATLTERALRHDAAPVWYPCLPANHIGGLAVILRAVLADARLVWGDADALESGPAKGATHVAVVSTQLARHDLRAYQTVLLGGARPPRERDANVVTTWGMTETGSGIVYDGVALVGVDVACLDGELLVRSPTLFDAYRDAPRPRRVGPDGRDDWFPTGDAGDVVDGRVSVRGRLRFVINTGGEKLWPEDLEAVLAGLDGVREVAVTAREDDEWGQAVVALVVSDGRRMDEVIRAAANERIGPWAKPKEIRYVAALPRTASGKLRRGDLVDLF
jgi:o-succinylbenzoate---CoA ligase